MGLMGLMGNVAQAQFGDYGVKVGIGLSTIADDLGTKLPILGATIGGFVNYTFESRENMLADAFYLQAGLNLVRKGSNYEEKFEQESNLSIRSGYNHVYYLQLPILACLRFELPLRSRGHVMGIYAGPAVSFGLFGRMNEKMVTPSYGNDPSVNYKMSGNAFDRVKRWDVSAIVGLNYEYDDFVFSIYGDFGFLATSESDDIMSLIANAQAGTIGDAKKISNGHNASYMLSVSYKLGKF